MKSLLILSLLALSLCSNASKIKQYLKNQGFTSAGAAGLMGTLDAKSELRPDVYELAKQKIIGLTQAEYVRKTNDGTYKNFVRDGVGFGLAQWNYWTRKQALLNACHGKIGDLNCQLGFLVRELKTDYRGVYSKLTTSNSVNDCCDTVLIHYDKPNRPQAVKEKRRKLCKKYQ